jgi:hypothetical protein
MFQAPGRDNPSRSQYARHCFNRPRPAATLKTAQRAFGWESHGNSLAPSLQLARPRGKIRSGSGLGSGAHQPVGRPKRSVWAVNEVAKEPQEDRDGWRNFFGRLFQLDQDGQLAGVMTEQKQLQLSLLEDEYLAKFFWKEPTEQNKQTARNQKKKALGWYAERSWTIPLDRLLERIYLLRCQLIHGASTFGGKFNRTALRRSTQMLGHLLPAVLLVIIDQGADVDWGLLCYPPMESGSVGQNGKAGRPVQPRQNRPKYDLIGETHGHADKLVQYLDT